MLCETVLTDCAGGSDARSSGKQIFSEKISTRIKTRPELEKALKLAYDIKEAAPDQEVILNVHELKRLARNAAELMPLSGQLQDAGVQLELLTGPLTGIYDPNGMGAMFFAVLAVAAQLDRNYIREKTLEGQQTAAAKGNHGGRPGVVGDGMLTFAVALKNKGAPVPDIAKKLSLKAGKNAGRPRRSPLCTGRSPKPRKPPRPTTHRSSARAARSALASPAADAAPTRS
ncbi:recombinase family protein [Streptomyces sp. NPDC007164]|uniref:recombinase family protein n=1 Tax=Streptomyces sp. NPDC007164 TaxID=3156918 RepID=UPI0033F5F4C5